MRGLLGLAVALVVACGCCCGLGNLAVGTDEILGDCCTQIEQADGFRWQLTTITAVAVALVGGIAVAVYWLLQRERRAYDLLAVPMVILFGFFLLDPLVRAANVKLDHSAAQHHRVVVLDRYRVEARPDCKMRCQTEYILIVPSWHSGYGSRMKLSVCKVMYGGTRVGGQVDVTSHPGLLGAEWIALTR